MAPPPADRCREDAFGGMQKGAAEREKNKHHKPALQADAGARVDCQIR
jgi:hypothetical protein